MKSSQSLQRKHSPTMGEMAPGPAKGGETETKRCRNLRAEAGMVE